MGSHILVDARAGSCELASYIVPQQRVRLMRRQLPTDIVFTGRGPAGCVLEIGIEYKTIWDTLACINDGRFAGNQLPALREFDYPILLIEGVVRAGSSQHGGRLEVYGSPMGRPRGWYDTAEWGRGRRIWTYSEFEHWYWSMMWRGGVTVLPFTANKHDSGRLVGSLWRSFNDKAWEEHTAHEAKSTAHMAPLRGDLPAFVRAISEYKAVGKEAALAAERAYGKSMRAICEASVSELAKMGVGGGLGKGGKRKRVAKFGLKRAQQLWNELGGIDGNGK